MVNEARAKWKVKWIPEVVLASKANWEQQVGKSVRVRSNHRDDEERVCGRIAAGLRPFGQVMDR